MKRIHLVLIVSLIGMSVFAVARGALYLSHPGYFASLTLPQVLFSFAEGARFDAAVLFIPLGLIGTMLLLPVESPLWKKFWGWLAFAVFTAAAVFLAGDVVYFGYVNRHTANELQYIANELPFVGSILWQYKHYLLALFLSVGAAAFLYRRLLALPLKPERHLWLKIILCAALSFLLIRGSFTIKPIGSIDAFRHGMIQGNLILNGMFSAYRYKSKPGSSAFFLDTEEAFRLAGADPEKKYPFLQTFDGGQRKNIVLIIMESWSAYYMGALNGGKFSVTPNFDNLSAHSAQFVRHYAPQKRSIDGIQAILLGIPPMESVASLGFGLEVKSRGNIGEIARQNGYHTIFMQTSKRRSYYMDSISRSLGFENYYGMEDIPLLLDYPDPKASVFGWDYDALQYLSKIIDKKGEPFFAVFFSGTTHTPFPVLPEEFMVHNARGNNEEAFLNALFYSDYSLGKFIESASAKSWFRDTIFIITADHTLGKFDSSAFPEDYLIPLIIFSPAHIEPAVYKHVTSHLDLLPTVLSLAGMKGQAAVIGSDVFDGEKEKKAFIYEGLSSALIKDGGWVRMKDNVILSSSHHASFARLLLSHPHFINMLRYDQKTLLSGTDKRAEEEMAKELMAYRQVTNILLNANRWAPPGIADEVLDKKDE